MKKTLLFAAALSLISAAQVMATTINITRYNGYYKSDGGEFNITPVIGNGDYASTVLVKGGYESFCIEADVNITIPGTYNATLSATDAAADGKALSKGTAYLYRKFATGTLSGYVYVAGLGRENSAYALQNAIWYLEGEADSGAGLTLAQEAINGSYYLGIVTTYFGSLAIAQANANGAFNVGVLNVYRANGTPTQDQLALVPDGGATAILLGLALGGLGLVSRRVKRA
ncbi:MAG: VPDSG-CTERM sorting domain-containing protein [Verrucomicrobia bacterium]|nr:VPDSG-CTERM sorting domain-containing protein [Verrucomicrobiota bacterium]MDE3098031.1 VPDSG-CTERM sorting domain-containing protein [Verrucomicrobiota bacterium]